MTSNDAFKAGRHFLQIPGPTPSPESVLRSLSLPTIDHRGPEFKALAETILADLKPVFGCAGPVILYPASGTGAWEAALVNTLNPGDRVLMPETGYFASLWRHVAERLGLSPETLPSDWRSGASAGEIHAKLKADTGHAIKAVCVVHNETSTGCVSDIAAVRKAMDEANHPALLMVDVISSLASIDYRHDAWGVDVTIAGSQKGLMLPPGLSFNAISAKARDASKSAKLPRAYWNWEDMLAANANGFFPYTPSTNLLYGLKESLRLLHSEGLPNVFARHDRLALATRAAVNAWGLEILCRDPTAYSSSLTAILMPEGHDADRFRAVALETFNISLGAGLGKLAKKVFRIGHLGDTNALTILGALAGVEMSLKRAGVPHRPGGVQAAMDVLGSG